MDSPLLPLSASGAKDPHVRITTFQLVRDASGDVAGFDELIEKVDGIFATQILSAAPPPGLLDIHRLLDRASGECFVYSVWDSAETCERSRANQAWYTAGQAALAPLVRFGQFKTEHFEARVVGPVVPAAAAAAAAATNEGDGEGGDGSDNDDDGDDEDDDEEEEEGESGDVALLLQGGVKGGAKGGLQGLRRRRGERRVKRLGRRAKHPCPHPSFAAFGPCTRVTRLALGDGAAAAGAAALDAQLPEELQRQQQSAPGFRGAQRLLGVGDAAGTFLVLTHWQTPGTLAGVGGAAATGRSIAASVSAAAVVMRPGSAIETREFAHSHLGGGRGGAAPPFFEEGSARAATFQLSCISLGVGIFVMPGVFATCGLGTGLALVLGWALAADFAMQAALQVCSWTLGCETYEGVLRAAFGEAGRKVALVALALACFTANAAHVQFISEVFLALNGPTGGFIGTLVGGDVKAQQAAAALMFGAAAMPFCFRRTLGELRHVSLVVVGFCSLTSLVVCCKLLARIAAQGPASGNLVAFKPVSAGAFADQVPIAAFGYSIIAELFAVRAEARDPAALGASVHAATAIVASIYCVVGVIGALAIEQPGANLLDGSNFEGDVVIDLLKLGLVVVITLLYPLINFPTVTALDALAAGPKGAPSHARRKLFSVVGLLCVIAIDTLLPDIGLVFGLAGSLGLGLIAFCLPTAAFLAKAPRTERAQIAAGLVVFLAGAAMTVGSTARILYMA
jgi:hypothetical protein